MGLNPLFRGTVGEVRSAIENRQLIPTMAKELYRLTGRSPGDGEVRSWENSIPHVCGLLEEAGLSDVQMLVELKLPITDARMDVVLVGSHPGTGDLSAVIIENKQWTRVALESELVQVTYGHSRRTHVHPANQVWGYRQMMVGFVPLLRMASVTCVANMHNANREAVRSISIARLPHTEPNPEYTRMYGADDRKRFVGTLRSVLSPEKAESHTRELLSATVRSTEPLMTSVARGLGQRSLFPLIDEQREAYDYVRAQVERVRSGQRKEVIVIEGEPGTGKSVIALELMRAFNAQGVDAVHATGSRSFTRTLRTSIARGRSATSRKFAYFNNFDEVDGNHINVIVADEAHRLRAHSRKNSKKPQVTELIEAARVPVFLLDERQNVRPSEVGSVELIRRAAADLGLGFHRINLRHQFRCGGAPEYIDWIDQLLGLSPNGGPQPWSPVENFELRVAAAPAAMEHFLQARMAEGAGARMAAGFCWSWSPPGRDGLVNDVVIGDWRKPWNARSDSHLGKIPPSDLWATDPGGFGQIGCIYTAQGFEYDYAGVIFGGDLVRRGQRWESHLSASKDYQVKREGDFDELVRKIYRVLATRGLKGAVLYSTDPETNAFFGQLGIPRLDANGGRL
ncbi:DUF2075 domain-containing protein [Nocardiopsis aegyptia]|uniref:AAA+ ATPase domain-containing protein n=1 Tax=Nocardiopsis aegyptia TaxID=220378 RepID=A0A7Z0ETA4_9ACTN|nr:DUF2075 domain-containing protein [Nocardiopsis aegyptia]NYJ37794.1 hypothetical protein [Nocardiopsis aegyptia]